MVNPTIFKEERGIFIMSVNTFKKQIWESALITSFREVSLTELLAVKPSSTNGTSATFNVGSLTTGVTDYAGSVEFEEINTSAIVVPFDKQKYWAMKLKDVDKVQLAGEVLMPMVADQGMCMGETIDTDFFKEAVAGAKTKIGSASAKKEIATPEEAYDYVVDLGTALSKAKAPRIGRYVIASSEFVNLLAKDKRVIDNSQVLANGVVQGMLVNGMQICASEEVPAGTVICMVAGKAVAGAKQLEETEAMRLQNDFADGVRGLCVYGVKTVRPEAISVLYYSIA